ncbi:MAG: hypothetical protein KTR20_06090 [Cellvibrionaceae bacterium]|nr:hypothetical protein [Cellvibrionaceae bacterium]
MQHSYHEVKPEDFMKIGGEKPSHLLIEETLIQMGGNGANGGKFKKEILKMAGWTGGSLTTYASRSDIAALAFNRVRKALENASDAESLKSQLHH